MAYTPFKASVVTPEKTILDGEITIAVLPADDGYLGVLNRHAPLVAKLKPGILKLDVVGKGEEWFVISGGYAQMKDNALAILTDDALAASEATGELAAEELAKAEALPGETESQARRRQTAIARAAAIQAIASGN